MNFILTILFALFINTSAIAKENTTTEAEIRFLEIFKEYIKDINQISKTNQYPDTSKIKEDYQGMHTNEPFLVK